ncbi:MAG TPA: ParB N-terminal domain-containing protein [Flavobacteriaceae bacterium]|nr:ParB N-terminal domain-containing protein [Flavobacteriaceae bacterium]
MIHQIEITIDKIKLLEENPRDISEVDMEKLQNDIKKDPGFLLQRPPLINLTQNEYICYAGTQRVKASKLNGAETIVCFVEENVPLNIQRERMLKDNLHRGEWNKGKLLELDFADWELDEMGFAEIDLNFLDDEPEYPDDLTAPKKDNPPTIKITFLSTNQMNKFEKRLNEVLKDFEDVTYSVSQGEL